MNDQQSERSDFPSSHLTDILDELADRLSAGDDVDLSPYLERCPDNTRQLREAFRSLRQMFSVRIDLANDVDANVSFREPLGDFQILREIGRGGMGIVYEARQLTLDRRVAVKVLPLAALLSPRELARFRNESRSAAMLRHPNIVGVHSIGCERGLHYYAMDLIDGGSFAQLIETLRESRRPAEHPRLNELSSRLQRAQGLLETRAFAVLSTVREQSPIEYCRSVARLGAVLADALHYAHEQGVTHRDIKPSNLLLDEQGNPWIADFGLAQIHGDASLTMTGDRVGTLRYMSPEQATGRKVLDHRTDVYSLGVTLFEMLALRPALETDDRALLLRQIEEKDVPLIRTVTPTVPRDLETVLSKATARLAEHRYDSASELAMDLRRFLDNRPVQARRVSRLQNAWRWAQRHRSMAALLCSTVGLLLCLSVIGSLGTWNYRQLALRERGARQSAERVRHRLQTLLRYQLMKHAESLEDVSGVEPMHEDVILATLNQYKSLLREAPDDLSVRIDVGRANAELGRILDHRFNGSKAQPVLEEAVRLLQPLETIVPNDDAVEYPLAIAHFVLGNVDPAARHYEECERLFRSLVGRHSTSQVYRSCWSYSLSFRGEQLLALGQRREAERLLREADNVARSGPIALAVNSDIGASSSWALSLLGVLHATAGRFELAENETAAAMQLWTEPGVPTWGAVRAAIAHATIHYRRSVVLYHRNETRAALTHINRCIASLEPIVEQFPTVAWARNDLCAAYLVRGDCHWHLSVMNAAERAYRRVLELDGNVSRHTTLAKGRLAELLWNVGNHRESSMMYRAVIDEANGYADRAAGLQRGQLLLNAADLSFRNASEGMESARQMLIPDDGLSVRQLGLAYYRAGDYEQALHHLFAAIERLNGGDAVDAYLVAMTLHQLGHDDLANDWLARGRASHACCLTLYHEKHAFQREAESLLMSYDAIPARDR